MIAKAEKSGLFVMGQDDALTLVRMPNKLVVAATTADRTTIGNELDFDRPASHHDVLFLGWEYKSADYSDAETWAKNQLTDEEKSLFNLEKEPSEEELIKEAFEGEFITRENGVDRIHVSMAKEFQEYADELAALEAIVDNALDQRWPAAKALTKIKANPHLYDRETWEVYVAVRRQLLLRFSDN